jgi:hypothetical protein
MRPATQRGSRFGSTRSAASGQLAVPKWLLRVLVLVRLWACAIGREEGGYVRYDETVMDVGSCCTPSDCGGEGRNWASNGRTDQSTLIDDDRRIAQINY